MTPAPALPEWRAESAVTWITYDDSDEWVAYHPLSSDVHLLTAPAHDLWFLLQTEPRGLEAVTAILAQNLGRAADEEFRTTVRETIALMDRAGLVRPSEL